MMNARNIATVVIACLLLVLCGFTAALQGADRDTLAFPFGHGAAIVESGSMEPTMPKGSLLLLERPQVMGVGDVVVYETASELVVHRIVAVDGSQIVCKGDANEVSDDPISACAVVAVVAGAVPVLGGVLETIGTPVSMLVIVIVAVALLLLGRRKPYTTGQ